MLLLFVTIWVQLAFDIVPVVSTRLLWFTFSNMIAETQRDVPIRMAKNNQVLLGRFPGPLHLCINPSIRSEQKVFLMNI